MTKHVYDFLEGNGEMRDELGGKGANLAEMTKLGLPVPPGFTITTGTCMAYLNDNRLPERLKEEVDAAIKTLESKLNKTFGSQDNCLLVSVRSGSKFSMPGMMDTILNLGLNDQSVVGFAKLTGDEHFAYDCYRRLLQMFGDVVYSIPKQRFELKIKAMEESAGVLVDQFSIEQLKELIVEFKAVYQKEGKEFPQSAREQLDVAIEAVFRSWNNPRAFTYRNLQNIDHDLGTAVNIQAMVFGNSGENSGTGVVFSRNPSTGESGFFGEYLINAQGEDVVAGIRTPEKISTLEDAMPEVYQELSGLITTLENHYHDMQDIEFTIEHNKLYMLQTRNGKRTDKAAIRIAVEMVEEGLLTKEEALLKIQPSMIETLLHAVFSEAGLKDGEAFSKGLGASPGASIGRVCFDAVKAAELHQSGEPVVLMRNETSPEDIEGMIISEAIVTNHGGMTSHAAVVARGMGICCVTGCEQLAIDEEARTVTVNDVMIEEGTMISVDGTSGVIYLGELEKVLAEEDHNIKTLLTWADEVANLQVYGNAETARDLAVAMDFNAQGIGLARTEHMFFGKERIKEMRKVILAEQDDEKREALNKLLAYQKADFEEMYAISQDKPMVIRLLDPPLHEFLPTNINEIEEIAKELKMNASRLNKQIKGLHETNPMLGHRGCRLGITFPEIYEMQAQAIIESAITLRQKGIAIVPHIMIPLVSEQGEAAMIRPKLIAVIEEKLAAANIQFEYQIGTMIELPRACLTADKVAESVDFFSFGTNDLTQMTYGFSRDDAGKFLGHYLTDGIMAHDPFTQVDEDGVGVLMDMAVKKGRQTKPDLRIGVCGEVGGSPESISFFEKIGLDYVSCSPYRVPVARLAVAQSALNKTHIAQ
ncbi:pyruvate, phosphate dikinase [Vagococcus coleopterorum]|uniref:Pyruvate, phosphate dikinase n=1 Tax=Vagococcus coleopterorum TaxID=2714946 RepID=A0A6G8ALL7_9ENTE|nr:pyruvate, phosphate dikinase [Vagococcus coleopterorum]QIL45870.1 pyruvate, phosphate dikinase [Vagococcus coleopterorum]